MIRTNAWILVKSKRVKDSRKWHKWKRGNNNQEPVLDVKDKALVAKMVDAGYALEAYKEHANSVLISIWDIDRTSLRKYEENSPDYKIVGYWTWKDGDSYCEYDQDFNWNSSQVLKYLPENPNTGLNELWDVSLIMGQPPRNLHPALNPVSFIKAMDSEGWASKFLGQNRIRIIYNGISYERSIDYLIGCDFADLPEPLKDDILDALKAQGICKPKTVAKKKPKRFSIRKAREKL